MPSVKCLLCLCLLHFCVFILQRNWGMSNMEKRFRNKIIIVIIIIIIVTGKREGGLVCCCDVVNFHRGETSDGKI